MKQQRSWTKRLDQVDVKLAEVRKELKEVTAKWEGSCMVVEPSQDILQIQEQLESHINRLACKKKQLLTELAVLLPLVASEAAEAVNVQAAAHPYSAPERTGEYVRQLLQLTEELPAVDDLNLTFERGFGDKEELRLPVLDHVYSELVQDDAEIAQLVCKASDCGALRLAVHISAQLNVQPVTSDEISVAGTLDGLVCNTWDILSDCSSVTRAHKRKRNDTEKSRTMRPDLSVLILDALIFMGEDMPDICSLQTAKQGLLNKVKAWSSVYHDQLDYLLCYAAAGDQVQFCVLPRSDSAQCKDVAGPFSTKTPRGKLGIIKAAIQTYSIIQRQSSKLPEEYQLGAPSHA